MRFAIIPARGGSKRIPRKNIRDFCGKPMIAYAISAAQQSGLFEHVLVSTDDAEIAEMAAFLGAETPFTRPSELADDHTPTIPVIAHAIQSCEVLGWDVDLICCIYPAVPFLQPMDLQAALKLFLEGHADFCFPVTKFPSAIQRAMRRTVEGNMVPIYPEYELTRTQDLEPAYHDTGQFYWGARTSWLEKQRIHDNAVGYLIPAWRVVDIDTKEDWERAELLYKALNTTRRWQ
ncbi:MAG: pseudaminic acid cytidylyltransferase [Betaproteobacteria bacterium]|nr:pseudaminic acid cytidylyltransferase [Betaproteobacteria bacterium]